MPPDSHYPLARARRRLRGVPARGSSTERRVHNVASALPMSQGDAPLLARRLTPVLLASQRIQDRRRVGPVRDPLGSPLR